MTAETPVAPDARGDDGRPALDGSIAISVREVSKQFDRAQMSASSFKERFTRRDAREDGTFWALKDVSLEVRAGDHLLLCSDGLTTMLSDAQIAQELSEERTLEDTCQALVALANDLGGLDNITVVLVEVAGEAA